MNSTSHNNIDETFIRLAFNISRPHFGLTSPNPTVGCVVAKYDTIIATGKTGIGGTPHAETIALAKAGDKAIGATLYVTLEPCSHFGKTPPCVDAIIKSQIARVVIATIDPDSRVNGLGIEKLKQAKIEVKIGVLEKEAQELNCGFFTAKKFGRPFITLKLATSFDGKIAHKNGDSKWITNEKSRQYAHYLRSHNDAILVGGETIRKDNSMLDCRILGLEKYSPKRIILSSTLNIDLQSQIIQSARKIPTYIATNNSNTGKFSDLGVNILHFPNSKIDLNKLVKKLCDEGINNLLIEGGANIATQFLQADLVDKLIWIKAPKIIGEDGIDAISNIDISTIPNSPKFTIIDNRNFDDDVMIIASRNR